MSHAVLSPSAAARWISCPASLLESKGLPSKPSVYADEGSLAHLVMAHVGQRYIDEGVTPDLFKDIPTVLASEEAKQFKFEVTPEWTSEVERCADVWVNELEKACDGFPDVAAFEVRVDLSEALGVPDSYGTADCLMLVGDVLHVLDYKHGRGVPVSAERNPQLSIYALGALTDENTQHVKKVVLHIVQPRVYGGVGTYEWERSELEAWGKQVRDEASHAIELYDGKVAPVDSDYQVSPSNCQFCRAAGKCAAVTKQFDMVTEVPRVIAVPDDPVKLARILRFKPVAEKFFACAEAAVYDLLMDGTEVPGFKLVMGNAGTRKWTLSETEMDGILKNKKLLEDERYTRKIISPTQAQKLVKAGRLSERQWKALEDLITRAPAKPTLVPESDKRPALSMSNEEFVDEIK